MGNIIQKQFEMILYQTDDENVSVNAMIKDETMWLTQKSMAALFDVEVPAINKHLKNIYEEGELQESSTISKMEIVQMEGTRQVKRNTTFYNLDAISYEVFSGIRGRYSGRNRFFDKSNGNY